MITRSFSNSVLLSLILKPAEVIMSSVLWVKVAHILKKKTNK